MVACGSSISFPMEVIIDVLLVVILLSPNFIFLFCLIGSERSLGFVSLELICLAFGVHSEMNARLSVSLLGHNKKEASAPEQSHERLDTLTVKSPSALPFKAAEGGRKVDPSLDFS